MRKVSKWFSCVLRQNKTNENSKDHQLCFITCAIHFQYANSYGFIYVKKWPFLHIIQKHDAFRVIAP